MIQPLAAAAALPGLTQALGRTIDRMRLAIALLIAVLALPQTSIAHSGGLNKDGCHNNRKTGDYHCHGGASAPRSAPPNNLAPARATSLGRSSQSRSFANCSEARAAGAAPVKRGDPGYGSHLDRDNDGVGCE